MQGRHIYMFLCPSQKLDQISGPSELDIYMSIYLKKKKLKQIS